MNSAVRPIFNEIVAESEICGSMNSARVHCSRENWSTIATETKKKKKKKEAENALELKTWMWMCIQIDTR